MSRRPLLCLFLLSMFVAPLFAQERPVFEERFNYSPALQFANGAGQGAEGTGVSGMPSDRAYVATVDIRNPQYPQPGARLSDLAFPAQMSQFTLTLWYRANRPIADAHTLIQIGAFYLLASKDNSWTMRLFIPPRSLWLNTGASFPHVPWSREREWIFYALTWDLASRTATIYQGTLNSPVQVQKQFSAFEAAGPVATATATGTIGNSFEVKSKSIGSRAFSGSIDNIRIFNRALAAPEVETIRAADTGNDAPQITPPTMPIL